MSAESFYSKVASYLYATLQGKGSIGRVFLWTFLCFFTEYLQTTSKVFPSFEENVDLSTNFITKTNLADKAWFSLLYTAEH